MAAPLIPVGSLAAFFGFLGVLAAALGAHLLGKRLDVQQLGWFDTATRMLLFHALALIGVALHLKQQRQRPLILHWIAMGMVLGVLLFCGSLFALALGAPRGFAHLAPIGGASLMLSWLLWAWAWRRLP